MKKSQRIRERLMWSVKINALRRLLVIQEVDGFLGVSVITPEKAQVLDYTCGIIWSEPYNLVVPKPEYESRLFAFVRPFQLPVIYSDAIKK